MRDAIALTEGTNPASESACRPPSSSIRPERSSRAESTPRPATPMPSDSPSGTDAFPVHTMVVTLEPCAHTGRTPPCTEAILDAGITDVIVGATDPDTRVRGSGIDTLRRCRVDVDVGVLADEVEANDPAYFHHRRTGRAGHPEGSCDDRRAGCSRIRRNIAVDHRTEP